jgi:hypothetical protein
VVAQTESPSLNRIDYLARENQFARAFFANHAGQKHGGDGRKHAQLDFRLSESRAIGSDNDIARCDKFTAATESSAVNQCDRRLGYLFEETEDRVERVQHLKDRFLDVILDGDTGAEGATVLVGVKNDRDELALIALTERLRDLAHHLDVEDVQRRTREGNPCDAIVNLQADVLVCGCHSFASQDVHPV